MATIYLTVAGGNGELNHVGVDAPETMPLPEIVKSLSQQGISVLGQVDPKTLTPEMRSTMVSIANFNPPEAQQVAGPAAPTQPQALPPAAQSTPAAPSPTATTSTNVSVTRRPGETPLSQIPAIVGAVGAQMLARRFPGLGLAARTARIAAPFIGSAIGSIGGSKLQDVAQPTSPNVPLSQRIPADIGATAAAEIGAAGIPYVARAVGPVVRGVGETLAEHLAAGEARPGLKAFMARSMVAPGLETTGRFISRQANYRGASGLRRLTIQQGASQTLARSQMRKPGLITPTTLTEEEPGLFTPQR